MGFGAASPSGIRYPGWGRDGGRPTRAGYRSPHFPSEVLRGGGAQLDCQLGSPDVKPGGLANSKAARLNAICPYYTMFPLDFPLGVLADAGADDSTRSTGRRPSNSSARTTRRSAGFANGAPPRGWPSRHQSAGAFRKVRSPTPATGHSSSSPPRSTPCSAKVAGPRRNAPSETSQSATSPGSCSTTTRECAGTARSLRCGPRSAAASGWVELRALRPELRGQGAHHPPVFRLLRRTSWREHSRSASRDGGNSATVAGRRNSCAVLRSTTQRVACKSAVPRSCLLIRLARPAGFEPATSRSGGARSIH